MKDLIDSPRFSGAFALAARLLFTWFAYVFATMLSLTGGISSDGEPVFHTYMDWLADSPGSVLVYVYLLISFLFFHFCFRKVEQISWTWRTLVSMGVCLIYFGLVWTASYPVLRYNASNQYEHAKRMTANPVGERIQEQMGTIEIAVARALWPDTGKIESRMEQEELFDPQFYFTVFTNLSMETGYELDYKYDQEGYWGYPELYFRETGVDEMPRGNLAKWHTRVQLNGTDAAYLEFALLYIYANQFYICDYALPFAAGPVIATSREFEKLINDYSSMSPWALKAACKLDIFPKVQVKDTYAVVSFASVSSGSELTWNSLVVGKEYPHQVVVLESQSLITHDFNLP